MRVHAPDQPDRDDAQVHTIEVWFSARQKLWVVERLGGDGQTIGQAHRCRTEAEARTCLADWLRRHPETHLSSTETRTRVAKAASSPEGGARPGAPR